MVIKLLLGWKRFSAIWTAKCMCFYMLCQKVWCATALFTNIADKVFLNMGLLMYQQIREQFKLHTAHRTTVKPDLIKVSFDVCSEVFLTVKHLTTVFTDNLIILILWLFAGTGCCFDPLSGLSSET